VCGRRQKIRFKSQEKNDCRSPAAQVPFPLFRRLREPLGPLPLAVWRTSRAYVGFHENGAVSGLATVSNSCHSSSVENDVISLFSLAFSYFCSAPLGLSRASNLASIGENNEKAFGADKTARQFSGCKSGVACEPSPCHIRCARRIVMMNSLYWTRHTANPTLESVGNSRRVRTCAGHVRNRVVDFTEIFCPLGGRGE
jgi:hypothetical protein